MVIGQSLARRALGLTLPTQEDRSSYWSRRCRIPVLQSKEPESVDGTSDRENNAETTRTDGLVLDRVWPEGDIGENDRPGATTPVPAKKANGVA